MKTRNNDVEVPKSKLKHPVFILVALAGLSMCGFEFVSYLRGGLPSNVNKPMFVCSSSGKAFEHTLKVGESIPVYSPYSGQNTGYPAEPCFWTSEGQVKQDATWVLLNEAVGKSGPTFCPDCGRLVVGHNSPPHTKAQSRRRQRKNTKLHIISPWLLFRGQTAVNKSEQIANGN